MPKLSDFVCDICHLKGIKLIEDGKYSCPHCRNPHCSAIEYRLVATKQVTVLTAKKIREINVDTGIEINEKGASLLLMPVIEISEGSRTVRIDELNEAG